MRVSALNEPLSKRNNDAHMNTVSHGRGFTDRSCPAPPHTSDLHKYRSMMLVPATLSAICTCAPAPSPPILRTATYRPVQLPKPAGRSTSTPDSPVPGTTLRDPSHIFPRTRDAQAHNWQAPCTRRRPLMNLPCTSRRPALRGQRRNSRTGPTDILTHGDGHQRQGARVPADLVSGPSAPGHRADGSELSFCAWGWWSWTRRPSWR
jgi:hypothetical protein